MCNTVYKETKLIHKRFHWLCVCTCVKEGNILFNDTLNTFYLRLYSVIHMVKTTQIAREETCCRHMGYSFRLTASVLLYAPFHRQDTTYHSLCYTSGGALAGNEKYNYLDYRGVIHYILSLVTASHCLITSWHIRSAVLAHRPTRPRPRALKFKGRGKLCRYLFLNIFFFFSTTTKGSYSGVCVCVWP